MLVACTSVNYSNVTFFANLWMIRLLLDDKRPANACVGVDFVAIL